MSEEKGASKSRNLFAEEVLMLKRKAQKAGARRVASSIDVLE